MSLELRTSLTAMAPGTETYVAAQGGVEPYAYTVVSGGGTIDGATGLYSAPAVMSSDPELATTVLRVTDDDGDTADASILVTDPLGLFCEILQNQMGLADGRVYIFDQKIMQPTDSGLYLAVQVLSCKPFANTVTPDGSGAGLDAIESINMMATLEVNAISRGPAALDRKEEILLALGSLYSQSQQELNSFNIGKLPANGQFINLSNVDGAAIPYRFNISVNMQYFVRKVRAVPYFDEFAAVEVTTQP